MPVCAETAAKEGAVVVSNETNRAVHLPNPVEANGTGRLWAEAQYREGLDRVQYPLLEVFLFNSTAKPVEWKRAFLNGREVHGLTNGVVWSQFYPAEKAPPGQESSHGRATLLQINLEKRPADAQIIEAETQDGQRVKASLERFSAPTVRLDAITFSWDFQRVFIAYTTHQFQRKPARVTINQADCTAKTAVLQTPIGPSPGLLAVTLPQPVRHGMPLHVRLELPPSVPPGAPTAVQALLRCRRGISLDDFGVKDNDAKLRQELGLDARPGARMVEADPACEDSQAHKMGHSTPPILATRRQWYLEGDERLSYQYQCTAATVAGGFYSAYSQITDALQINPYHLAWSQAERFIESQERYYVWAKMAAAPRCWLLIPELFTTRGRFLEPDEYRSQIYGAVAIGLKGLRLFMYGGMPPSLFGYEKSPRLLAAVKQVNREIKSMEPILSAAIPVSTETIGSEKDGLRLYTLWSGDEGLLVIARNLDYHTDRQPNDFGNKPRCTFVPKKNVALSVRKPAWLTPVPIPGAESEAASAVQVTDLLSRETIRAQRQGGRIQLTLPALDVVRVLWIPRLQNQGGST
ncbi:MAG: hypothetical protein HY360_20560 [Verrucomicrobia bacterium]|nr:hypothetical protein [Verrucomicrobiota bacterium]